MYQVHGHVLGEMIQGIIEIYPGKNLLIRYQYVRGLRSSYHNRFKSRCRSISRMTLSGASWLIILL